MPRRVEPLPLDKVVADHFAAVNQGWLQAAALVHEVPLPLLRPVRGKLIIEQATSHSKEHNRLFAADAKTKQTGLMRLEMDLELEGPLDMGLRLGDVTVTLPDGTVVKFPPEREGGGQ